MADILIKGMEMPNDCYDCPLIIENKEKNGFYDCILIGKACALSTVHKDCPLVELPPHRRLIDADEVKKLMQSGLSLDTYEDQAYVCSLIDEIPTIIEASKENT